MSLYQIIGFLIVVIILGQAFHLGPAIFALASGLASIPLLIASSGGVFALAVWLACLIAGVAIVKILFPGKREDDDESI